MRKINKIFFIAVIFSIIFAIPVFSNEDNYIDDLNKSGGFAKWNTKNLTYCSYSKNNSKRKLIDNSFSIWQKSLNDFFSFEATNNFSDCNIEIIFIDKLNYNYSALTKNYYLKNFIIKSNIYIEENNPDNELISLLLHEIGHSLGLIGHSTSSLDIMSEKELNSTSKISSRDIITLKKIYDAPYNTAKKNTPPSKSVSLIYADYLKRNNEYKKAVKVYKKLLKQNCNLEPALYSIGYCYYQLKDYKNASYYFESAFESDKNNEIYLSSLIKTYIKLNKTDNAKLLLNNFINRNPHLQSGKIIEGLSKALKTNN